MYFPVSCVHTHACICFKHIYAPVQKLWKMLTINSAISVFFFAICCIFWSSFFLHKVYVVLIIIKKKKSKVKTAGSFLKKVILVEISWSPRTGGGDIENVLFKGTSTNSRWISSGNLVHNRGIIVNNTVLQTLKLLRD